MDKRVMHSPEMPFASAMRAGLWLVIDLIDDMKEWGLDPDVLEHLTHLRNGAMDILFDMRRLEEDVLPGEPPLRLGPGAPAA